MYRCIHACAAFLLVYPLPIFRKGLFDPRTLNIYPDVLRLKFAPNFGRISVSYLKPALYVSQHKHMTEK